MTTFAGPKLVRGGLVQLDPESARVERVIPLQYNPETLSRSFQVQSVEGQGGDRSQPLRLKGPPVETLRVEAEIDATDGLEAADPAAEELGVLPQLAALEALVYPTSGQLLEADALARSGTLQIAPMEAPLTLFVWGERRVLPVRVTELSVTEEAFGRGLQPIRAKVSLGLRVLSVDDLGFRHKGGELFMVHLQAKEQLARRAPGGALAALGIGGIP